MRQMNDSPFHLFSEMQVQIDVSVELNYLHQISDPRGELCYTNYPQNGGFLVIG